MIAKIIGQKQLFLSTSNNSFESTEISYLKNSFFNLAKNARRYSVKNNSDPTSGDVTEEKNRK